jgi:hypothetical protein
VGDPRYQSIQAHTSVNTQAAPTDNSALPEYYDAEWARFSPGVKLANRLLDFTNRHYVKRVRDEGHLDILTVRNVRGVSTYLRLFWRSTDG